MTPRWIVASVMACAAGAALTAQDAGRPRAEARAQRVNDRIRALQVEADRLAAEARTLLGELRALEVDAQLQAEQLREAQAASARGRAAVEAAAARFAAIEQQRESQLPGVKVQLVDIYKRGRIGYARLLFGTTGAREFGRALRAVGALVRINDTRIAAHRRTLDDLRGERARLEAELDALEAKEAQAREVQAAADRATAARGRLLAQIDARRDLTAQLAGELQVAHERLQQQLAALAGGGSVDAVTVPLAPFRGALEWPVPGRLLVPFGQPSKRAGDVTPRNGVEIAAPAGTPVQAVHPGVVSYAEPFAGLGNGSSSTTARTPTRCTATWSRSAWHAAGLWTRAPSLAGSARRRRVRPPSTSKCASTAAQSIPYNG
jgi:septal ring factor EnvC (AmiA/AmiB activator)